MGTILNMITDRLKSLETLAPGLEQIVSPLAAKRGAPETPALPKFPQDYQPPTQAEVLRRADALPSYSVLLGIGADDDTFHLDLNNPVSGSVLIVGDDYSNQHGLLRSILASAVALNDPREVNLSVISRKSEQFAEFSDADHLQEILPCNDEIINDFILDCAQVVDDRRNGARPAPAQIIFIDDLAECLTFLGQDAYERLYWLVRHGPRYKVWTFATMPAERWTEVDPRFFTAFRTTLIGHVQDQQVAMQVSQRLTLETERLQPDHFYIPYGDEWLVFCACPTE